MFEMAFLQRKEFRYASFFLRFRVLSPSPSIRHVGVFCRRGARPGLIAEATCNGRVLHEPLGEPFYYGPERMSSRFTAENRPDEFQNYAELTFAKVSGLQNRRAEPTSTSFFSRR